MWCLRAVWFIALAVAGVAASTAPAQDWGTMPTISSTMGVNANRLCMGEASRGDIGCPTYAPSVTTAGDVSITGNVSAAKFLGDGSQLTGVTADATDRITSGTTSFIVISDTGYISLTQASTNTGWFDPTRGLVTLGVSSTGPISGTNGYFSGNVGIGTKTPGYPLQVSGTVRGRAFYPDDGQGVQWGNSYVTGSSASRYLALTTSNTEALRIVSSGYVGIGTNIPLARLHIKPATDVNVAILDASGEARFSAFNDSVFEIPLQLKGSTIKLLTSAEERMRIVSSGLIGIGTAAPGANLDISSANAGLMRLQRSATQQGIYDFAITSSCGGQTASFCIQNNGAAGRDIQLRPATSGDAILTATGSSSGFGRVGVQTTQPSASLHVSGTTRITSWTTIAANTTPTTALDVYGTISATNFIGNGSGLTGLASGDRLVSGSVSAIAEQTSGTIRVSGTLALTNTGNESCNAARHYSLRINPATGILQMCRP